MPRLSIRQMVLKLINFRKKMDILETDSKNYEVLDYADNDHVIKN